MWEFCVGSLFCDVALCFLSGLASTLLSEEVRAGPEVIELFSCSSQLSIKLQQLIKMLKNADFLAFILSDVVFILIINVKMPTIVGILTFMSRINFLHS